MFSPEKKAVVVASLTAVLLIIIKGVFGVLTGSMAILTSAIDSTLDFFVSLMNFFAIRKSEQPIDEQYNYGHGKIEGFGALIEGLIIFISGITVIYFSFFKILHNEFLQKTSESIYVMIISIIITFLLVNYLSNIAQKTQSLIIKSDLLHYKTDLFTNFGIIIALVFIKIFNFPVIDPVISIAIAFYIIYGSIEILKDGFEMLMDKKISDEHLDFIKEIIKKHPELTGFHFLKTRKSGKRNFIEFHIVFRDDNISLREAHTISDELEASIIEEIPHATVMIHLDYFDDSHDINNPKLREFIVKK
ncbi:cation diffusion facilitator family transporter [Candidatus Gracilibacteria bacterium]|nr:cation diffusion facilitator family transporter [Candidatus Gracilibacteria bacterium]